MFASCCVTDRNRPQPSASVHMRSLWPCLLWTPAKVVAFGGFKRCRTSFRVAGVRLRDIPTCFITCSKSFCMMGAIFLQGFQKMTRVFRGRHSTLETSVILRGRSSTLDVTCCVFFCESHWSSRDNVQIAWQAWDMVREPLVKIRRVWNSTVYTFHSTLCTLHFMILCLTLHTVHFTLYTSNSTLYTPHSTLFT